MKHYEDRVIPERTVNEHVYTTCDLCKKKIEDEDNLITEEVAVQMRRTETFSSFAPDGFTITTEFDICPACFAEVVFFLREKGAEPTIRRFDF